MFYSDNVPMESETLLGGDLKGVAVRYGTRANSLAQTSLYLEVSMILLTRVTPCDGSVWVHAYSKRCNPPRAGETHRSSQ